MNEEDSWEWWQTYAAVGGAAVGSIVLGQYYMKEKERLEQRKQLVTAASENLKDSTVIVTGSNTGVG
jgi:hypothetical protein